MEESLTMSASSYLPLTRKAVSKKYGSAVCS
jgi:DNA integrity scanning protein DisA with diadenylate cyclase activity